MHFIVERIIELASHLGHWGYLVIFLVVLLECQALLGLFVPGESLVLVSGFLAGQGVFKLDALIATIALGAIAGDSLGYELGRYFGRDWLERHGPRVGIREEHLKKIDRFIGRHGGKSVFFSHFMHLLRAVMPFMAGANRMAYWRFVTFNAAGCVLWSVLFSLLGYFMGESWPLVEKWIGRAGSVVGVVVVLAVALVWLGGWIARHETELREQWRAFLGRPRVVAFRRRFAAQIEFIEERLTPGGYLGLHLTVGAVIFLLAGWWFGGVIEDLITHDPLFYIDHRLAAWFGRHSAPVLTHVAKSVGFAGSIPFLTVATMIVGLALIAKRSWHRLAVLVLAVGGGSLLDVTLRHLFQHTRHVIEDPSLRLVAQGFPSGYTVGATLFYGLLAFFVAQSVPRWRWQVFAPLLAVFLILLVGLSRLYLRTHYLSDVLAAIALGIMWLAFSITAVEIHRRYRLQQKEAPRSAPPSEKTG